MGLERADHSGYGRALLADRDVDAGDVAATLIDDGVERDGGLAGLAIAESSSGLKKILRKDAKPAKTPSPPRRQEQSGFFSLPEIS